MRNELIYILSSYLMGWKTIPDCAEWFASLDWNSIELESRIAQLLGRFELLITEVVEGLRSDSELWQEASTFVSQETQSWYLNFISPTPYESVATYSGSFIEVPSPEYSIVR